jgi:hypothetical protein
MGKHGGDACAVGGARMMELITGNAIALAAPNFRINSRRESLLLLNFIGGINSSSN